MLLRPLLKKGCKLQLRCILNEPCSFEFEVQYSGETLDVLAVLWKLSILDVMMISCRRVPGMFKVFLFSLKNPNEFRVWSLGFSI